MHKCCPECKVWYVIPGGHRQGCKYTGKDIAEIRKEKKPHKKP